MINQFTGFGLFLKELSSLTLDGFIGIHIFSSLNVVILVVYFLLL